MQLIDAEATRLTFDIYETLSLWKTSDSRINCVSVGQKIGIGRNKVKASFRWLIKNGFLERIQYRLGNQWNTLLRLTEKRLGHSENPVVNDWMKNTVIKVSAPPEGRPLCVTGSLPVKLFTITNEFMENHEKTSNTLNLHKTSPKTMRSKVTDSIWDAVGFGKKAASTDLENPFAAPPKARTKAAKKREEFKNKNYVHRSNIPVKDWTTKHVCQEFQAMYRDRNPMVVWDMYASRFLFAWADWRAVHYTNGEEEMQLMEWFFSNPAGWYNKTPEHSWKLFMLLADRNMDMVRRTRNAEKDREEELAFIEKVWGK